MDEPPCGDRGPGSSTFAFALVAFAPQLWSQPGVADSDTKSYLYLDPGRFLGQSATMWDPSVGLGTVTHEQIGFLFPLGPFFWAVHALGIPLWVGQRLWIGALLFGAGSGVLYLCRTLGLDGPGRYVAAAVYMLSPYFLQDVGRISTLVLPWAGLGWMVAFTIRAVRDGGWRYPALFALVWLTISGNNASGPIYAAVAPVLWVLYAVVITKEHSWRQVWSASWKIVVLTGAVSLWWAWSLAIESRYGLNVLGTTESVSAVAKTSLSSEVLRGLGYWFYYGSDVAGPWAATEAGFTQHLWLIAVTFADTAVRTGRSPRRAMAAAGVLRAPGGRGHGPGGGVAPVLRPLDRRCAYQDVHDQDHRRSGPAVDRTGPHPWSSSGWRCCSARASRPWCADGGGWGSRWRWWWPSPWFWPTHRYGTAAPCSTGTDSPLRSRST